MINPVRRVFSLLAASLVVTVSPHANAAIIDSISNLDINGTAYDVTFHTNSVSFNDLWDADNDGIFGGGASVFSSQPTFWLDQAAARVAVDAVAEALGTEYGWRALSDAFLVPCGVNVALTWCAGTITAGRDSIASYNEPREAYEVDGGGSTATGDDVAYGGGARFAYVSFAPSNTASSPVTLALLIPGLVAIAGIRKRRKKASTRG